MNQHVSNTMALRGKTVLLWTPWGGQRVPDLDKALNSPVKRRDETRSRPDRRPGKPVSKQ